MYKFPLVLPVELVKEMTTIDPSLQSGKTNISFVGIEMELYLTFMTRSYKYLQELNVT